MIGQVLQMCNKVSEFPFYSKGSNCFVKLSLEVNIHSKEQFLILQDMIGHVLHMCSEDSEFSFCPLGPYQGQTMTFSIIYGLSLEFHLSFKEQTIILQDMIGYVLGMCKGFGFFFQPRSQMMVSSRMHILSYNATLQ